MYNDILKIWVHVFNISPLNVPESAFLQLNLSTRQLKVVDHFSVLEVINYLWLGIIENAFDKLAVNVEILEKEQPIIAEVKRTGVFQDIEKFLQLRVGDTFIFYQSIGECTEGFPASKFTAVPKSCA